jgi:hypothetical protein
MTYPQMKPCRKCQSPNVACYTYESGWSRVECDSCTHISSCEGRKLDAIRAHNSLAPIFGDVQTDHGERLQDNETDRPSPPVPRPASNSEAK